MHVYLCAGSYSPHISVLLVRLSHIPPFHCILHSFPQSIPLLPSTPPLPHVLRSQIQCPSSAESTADPQAPPIGGATRSGEDHFGSCPGQGQWAQLDKDMFVGTDCECMCGCTSVQYVYTYALCTVFVCVNVRCVYA